METDSHNSILETNEYPDLDYSPKYPWAGVRENADHPPNHAEAFEYSNCSKQGEQIRHDSWNPIVNQVESLREPALRDFEYIYNEPRSPMYKLANSSPINYICDPPKEFDRFADNSFAFAFH